MGRNGQKDNPQNGPRTINPNRQAVAANAKIPMKPHIVRPPAAKGLPVRGEGTAQHQPASAHQQQLQPLQRRPSGESLKHDPWDTDGESIDTTINHSIVQGHDSQQHEQQQSQLDHEHSQVDGDEASGSDEVDYEEVEFDSNVDEYLAHHQLAHAPRKQQMQFLQETQPHIFAEIDGDSYPTTTDGEPTEEQPQSHVEDPGSPSLSPEREHLPQGRSATLVNQRPLLTSESHIPRANSVVPQNAKIWQQGAQIRGQQRNDTTVQAGTQPAQQRDLAHQPTSQPPTYSQATDGHHQVAPQPTHARVQGFVTVGQTSIPSRHNRIPARSGRPREQTSRIMEPVHSLKDAPIIRAQIVPVVQQHAVPEPAIELPVDQGFDYDREVLFSMNYDELKDESFDKNPRNGDSVWLKEMAEKPLSERLQLVQHECDPGEQSAFFSRLPTDEWEEAGDWFLDQFSAIIKKTTEARKKKRKAAQGFEHEVETRHLHIAKRQRLVESAMAKMQAQGEGLVPNSPRVSQTPRPRRG